MFSDYHLELLDRNALGSVDWPWICEDYTEAEWVALQELRERVHQWYETL